MLLIGAGTAIGLAAFADLPRPWEASLPLAPLERPQGFRYLSAGATSGTFDPLAGLTRTGGAEPVDDLCAALFGPSGTAPGVVPVAAFSDYNCPYCRVLSKRLIALEDEGAIGLRWHELPLLGPASEQAARGALAAARQGRHAELHERLMGTPFLPTTSYLRAVSESLGIDADRLIADMKGSAVAARLDRSRNLARLFGVVGTPAIVVGRTLVQGEVGDRTLRRLIELERAEGPVRCA